MKNLTNPRVLVTESLLIVINFIGAFLALSLRLPIYLDSIGTIASALAFGPVSGMIVGALTSILNGFLFDPTSFYYLPVQLLLGLLTGILFKNHRFQGLRSILYIFLITLLCSIVSSIITAFVFSGITSSGSSYVVAVLHNVGLNLFSAVFSTQIFTDLIDKYLSFFLAFLILKIIPKSLLNFK